MGGEAIFLLVLVVVGGAIAFAVFGGAGGKLTKDKQEGDLPGQQSEGRPDHLAVSTDPDDTPEPRPARTE
jgi:hypothetical protein